MREHLNQCHSKGCLLGARSGPIGFLEGSALQAPVLYMVCNGYTWIPDRGPSQGPVDCRVRASPAEKAIMVIAAGSLFFSRER